MAYGFKALRMLDGSPYNGGLMTGYIVEGSQIYAKGDLLSLNTSATNETAFARAEMGIGSADNAALAVGIAQYFEYTDTAGNFHQTNYVPAPAAAQTALANRIKVWYIPTIQNLVFKCTSDDVSNVLNSADINGNFDVVIGTADATRQQSAHELDADSIAVTAATPLRLIGLVDEPGNTWGNTAGSVEVEVIFISSSYNSGVAGLT